MFVSHEKDHSHLHLYRKVDKFFLSKIKVYVKFYKLAMFINIDDDDKKKLFQGFFLSLQRA